MRRLALRSARILPLAAMIVILLVAGCSKDRNPIRPQESAQQLGTLVAAAGVADPNSALLWSVATDELVCSGAVTFAQLGHLIAIRRTTGAVRTLDAVTSIMNALAPDGSAVYYNAILWGSEGAIDSIQARRIGLGSGSTPRRIASCGGFCLHIIQPAPDGDQVAISTLGSDSIQIHSLSTGSSRAVAAGVPVAFSPNSAQLLTREAFGGLNTASLVTLATGVVEPAGLDVPDLNGGELARWDAQGPVVLYVSEDRKSLYRARAGAAPTLLWSSPDSLHGSKMATSPSGQRVAVWTSRAAATDSTAMRLYQLYVVDETAGAVRIAFAKVAGTTVLALRRAPRFGATADIFPDARLGGMAFTGGETELAYLFDGRLYRTPALTPVTASIR